MTTEATNARPREISHLVTGQFLRHLNSDPSQPLRLARILKLAGETRDQAVMLDDTEWSSYAQFRRLLEACAVELGGLEALTKAGVHQYDINQIDSGARYVGSPYELYRDTAMISAAVIPIQETESEQTGPDTWIIRRRMVEGFEPFPELCAFTVGTWAGTPVLFGVPAATAVEHDCQCRGALGCVIELHPKRLDSTAERMLYLENRTAWAERQMGSINAVVADIVAGDDIDSVLERLVSATARSVVSPGFILAVDSRYAPRSIYSAGLTEQETSDLGAKLLANDPLPDGTLVAEVVSKQRHYGRMAAVRPIFLSNDAPELPALDMHARLAAAALDSATSLADARQQTATAEVLLALSSTLNRALTVEDVCARVARAVLSIVDCDRSLTMLFQNGAAAAVSTVNYPPEIEAMIRSSRYQFKAPEVLREPDLLDFTCVDRPRDMAYMRAAGVVAALTVPIHNGTEPIGMLIASVTDGAHRLSLETRLVDRLQGLADQAATAITNARLLEQIRHQALHDPLTGLPNRALILDRAEQMLGRARRELISAGALFVDLDNFKDVNDTLGHAAGDQILQAVAQRLTSALRETDTVARLGGDEFVVLVEGAALIDGPDAAASRILDVLQEPFQIAGSSVPIRVTASVGIAIGDRSSAGELLRDADIALYEAKAKGRNCSVIFHTDMGAAVRERHELDTDLRQALDRGELFVLYQPTFNLASGLVTGAEALVRWQHPTRGVVGPDNFIPLAESTGLIIPIGVWVLNEACRQAALWHAEGHPIAVSVNVSARQLEHAELVDEVAGALAASGLDPGSLTLEITETTLMVDAQATAVRLLAIKKLGVRIAIDDFGTGYSSMAYLQQFPVDSLKIDRSFISGFASSEESGALIHTLVQLGKALGLETLAEGIEENSQLHELQDEQCDSGQGFLFARPLTPHDMDVFLATHAPAPAGQLARVSGQR
jgi:diguanylate cyclase (GGDEF)-like protein